MAGQGGTEHETDVVNFLRAQGLQASRPTQTTQLDTGDIHAGDFVLQAKRWANVADAVRDGTDGAQAQARRAGKPFGAAVVRRPRKGVAESYVVMPLRVFAVLLKLLGAPRL